MSYRAFTSLPIVDISGLRSPDLAQRQAVADQLGHAAREVGFLYVTGHAIAGAVRENLKARARDYFSQPLNSKMEHYIGKSSNHSGYVPEGEEQFAGGGIDHKEAYDVNFDFTESEQRYPLLGKNQWPLADDFRQDISAYYAQALQLGHTLFRGFALALGLPENTLTALVTTPPSQLRLVHYPYNAAAPQDRPGIGAHTDYECFTILLATAPGLEVLNGDGQWIDVPVLEDALVINIGDMLEVLSNGQFVATAHRVRKVAEERYSFPLFCACDYPTVIAPIAGLAARGGKTYAPVVCGEHLYAQTIQTFAYLKRRREAGQLVLPQGSLELSSFGLQSQEVSA